ncbi:MAG TPA: M1 family metallopeptidase [Clostridia bacterium]|nr:M1 family metallopeptidase [Clostridia bacterium]
MKRIISLIILISAAILVWVIPVCGDSFSVYVNGIAWELEHTPIVNSGDVYLEIKELFALVGRTTIWDADRGVFAAKIGQSSMIYDPDSNTLKKGGQIYYFTKPPLEVLGNVYVCAREFSQVLDFGINVHGTKLEFFGNLVSQPRKSGYPRYDIEAIYANGKIFGSEKVTLVNNSSKGVRDLFLVLPAPSINPQSTTKVFSVMVDGVPVEFQEGETYLRVVLPQPMEPLEQCSVEISFDTIVPKGPSRLGYTEDCAVLSCWYPVVSLDKSVPVYTGFGEPYSFQSGIYTIDMTVDQGMQVFSGLEQEDKKEDRKRTRYKFSSSLPIREAAFVIGQFNVSSVRSGSSTIYYAYNNYRPKVVKYSAEALEMFGQWWGKYPYPSLTLVEVPLEEFHGMEYGGLILLSSINNYDIFTIVHEVAHQWWQGLVGNNQETEAWIDEGLANYSTLLFLESKEGYSGYASRVKSMQNEVGKDFGKLQNSLHDFSSKDEYKKNAYIRGALLWHEVREQAGREGLINFLRSIQEHYKFERITTEEIIFLLENAFPGIEGI